MKQKRLVDPIVPFKFYANREEEMLDAMRELYLKSGLRRFLLIAPSNGVRLTGFPDNKVYRDFAELLVKVKKELAADGIEVGWWCGPTLKSGNASYQRITGIDGETSDISSCPLDKDFAETFSDNIATVARIAKPFMIQFEDDFELSNHTGIKFGCFCPLHLEKFGQEQNHYYSREALMDIFSEVTPESIKLRRAWAQLSCESLVSLSTLIRKKINAVAPETRTSLCQSGCSSFDGDMTGPVARALAGETRPVVRVGGANYSTDDGPHIPRTLFNALYSKQHLPDDFELIHESDTYPHTRFFCSSSRLRTLMFTAFSYGLDGSLFYNTQYLDNPMEETGYFDMFKNESKRFDAVKAAVSDCELDGCEVVYLPFEHTTIPYDRKTGNRPVQFPVPWANILGRFGIPYTSANGKVKLISGTTVNVMTDDEIEALLRGSVFLDGKAAHCLAERGFGKLIGAEVVSGDKATFNYEKIRDIADFKDIKGRLMYNFIFAPAGSEGGAFYKLEPLDDAEILTDFADPSENPVIPGMIRFENKLGGRIAITAFDIRDNESSAVFNYRKKEIIRKTIEWLGRTPLPVVVANIPNVFCIFNRSKSNDYAIVTITNLSTDSFNSLDLVIAPEWIDSDITRLNNNGKWVSDKIISDGRRMTLKVSLAPKNPVVLKMKRLYA